MKIVLVTGGFDPIHSGHIAYITAAAQLGDRLIVGPNSDDWLVSKKGRAFMPFEERASIIRAIKGVHEVVSYDDGCGNSSEMIKDIHARYPKDEIIFANGGDRNSDNVAEMQLLGQIPNLSFAFGVGGDSKANSSRWILERWSNARTERDWGRFDILKDYPGCRLKEIVVKPNHCLSYQKHEHRSELWFVRSGVGTAIIDNVSHLLYNGQYVYVPKGSWHQLINGGKESLHILEIQHGLSCDEQDIQRMNENNYMEIIS